MDFTLLNEELTNEQIMYAFKMKPTALDFLLIALHHCRELLAAGI